MDFIRSALETVCQSLDDDLQRSDRRPDAWVVLTNIFGHDDNRQEAYYDKIVISAYNIGYGETGIDPGSVPPFAVKSSSPVITVDIAVTSHFVRERYKDGLSAISRAISYFHRNPVFDHGNSPRLDASVHRMTIQPVNLDIADVSRVIAMHGGIYLPTMFYRLQLAVDLDVERLLPPTVRPVG